MDNEDVGKLRFARNIFQLSDRLQFVRIDLSAFDFGIVRMSLALVGPGMMLRDEALWRSMRK